MRRRILMRELLIGSLIFFVIVSGCKKRGELPKDVLLTVNGQPVYIEELEEEVAQTYPWKDADNSSKLSFLWDPSRRAIREQLIEHLIERKLLLQAAEKQGVKITKAEFQVELSRITGGINKREFLKLFARYGIDPGEWKEKVKEDLIIKKLLNKVVYSNLKVTDSEIKKYYSKHITQFVDRRWVRVHMIVFDSLAEAQNFKKKIKNANDFLRVETAKNPYAPHEGYVFYKGELSPEEWKILNQLPLRQVSQIFNLKNGYYIFLVMDRGHGNPGGKKAIFQKIKNIILSQKKEEAYKHFLASLKKKAKIKINPLYR